jgi:hypothetical protein
LLVDQSVKCDYEVDSLSGVKMSVLRGISFAASI